MKPPATKGNKKENRLGDKIEDKTSGRHTIQHQGGHLKKTLRTPNSTLFEKKMQNQTTRHNETRRKTSWETNWETRRKTSWETSKETRDTKPREGGHPIQHRHTCGETMGDKRILKAEMIQGEDTIQHRHTCGDNGRQFGDKTSGRRTRHPTQARMWGDSGRQWQTREKPQKNRHTITGTHVGRQWETKRGHKTSRRRTHHPTQARVCGDNGRQWERMGDNWFNGRQGETRPGKGRHTIQHGQTRGDKTSGRRTHHPKRAGTHVGRQWETKREDKTSGRRTHHPTEAHMWGDNGKQRVTREREDIEKANTSSRHTCGETTGDKWRQETRPRRTP